jgi:hypothetical protein
VRRGLLAACGVAVVAGAVAAAVLLTRDGAAPGHAVPALTAERADQLGAQLASGDEAAVRQAIALPPGQDLDPAFVRGLAALRLDIDERTFTETEPGEATVDATATTGGATNAWTVRMARVDGAWLIVSTAPKAGS